MKTLIVILLLLALMPGCTMHFKATDLELDTEEPHSINETYELEKIGLFS